jgi:hypothetical protein
MVDISGQLAIRRARATMWPDQMTIHKSAGSSAGFPARAHRQFERPTAK